MQWAASIRLVDARIASSLRRIRHSPERFAFAIPPPRPRRAQWPRFEHASGVRGELCEELDGCEDGEVVAEAEEMLVACDEERAARDGEREQVIVAGVR